MLFTSCKQTMKDKVCGTWKFKNFDPSDSASLTAPYTNSNSFVDLSYEFESGGNYRLKYKGTDVNTGSWDLLNNKIITRWKNTEDYIEISKFNDDEMTLYTNFSSDRKVHMVFKKD